MFIKGRFIETPDKLLSKEEELVCSHICSIRSEDIKRIWYPGDVLPVIDDAYKEYEFIMQRKLVDTCICDIKAKEGEFKRFAVPMTMNKLMELLNKEDQR